MGLLGVGVAVVLYTDHATQKTRLILVLAAVGAAITVAAAALAADAATRRVHRQHAQPSVRDQGDVQRRIGELGFLITRGRQDLQELRERLRAGETAAPRSEELPATTPGDPVIHLAYELRKAQSEAWNAVLEAASRRPADPADQRVGVFVNLARRMQSLSHRAIQGLDELENQVEDPDLLKGLFRVDHLSTRMRRQAESLAVIGGAAPRRQWSRPVTVYEVLRSAIAEVEHYNRVKVVPPVEGTLAGSAVADVIHLLAELIENATKFAPPHTQVLVRVDTVTAGLAIEVEDRGLGVPREDQRRLNDLLVDLERVNTDELLQDGRIGLLVVSALSRRHGIRVQLQANVYGGTQAIVVVPRELVGTDADDATARPQEQPAHPPGLAASAAASVPAPLPSPAPLPGSGHGTAAGPNPTRDGRDSLGVRPTAQPPATWDQHPATPVRQSGPPAGVPNSGQAPAWPTPAAGTGSALPGQAETGERPPLPRRRAQANLAPELIDAPALQQQEDQEVELNPGLMAAFQKGMRSGQQVADVADGTDGKN
ncbi:MAG: ATP-binding protein [Actinoallomurus sp.]